jgi:hypothetical protein
MVPTRAVAALLLALLLAGCSQPSGEGTPTPTATTQVAHVGDTVGYYTIQAIHADRLEGLYRYPYPVAQGEGEPKTLRVGETVGAACEGRTYTLAAIDAAGASATFTQNTLEPSYCPICLSGDTLIDTPSGPVNVKEVRVGMEVWGLKDGQREAVPVLKVGQAPSPQHQVVRLALEDGRQVEASPGHPLTDGRAVGDLRPGDEVDGSPVVSARLVAYGQPFTYDILAGEGYWANGILLASTLAKELPKADE